MNSATADVVSAPLDSPAESAHFPDPAALRAAVTGPKMHDDTVRFDDPLQFDRCLLGWAQSFTFFTPRAHSRSIDIRVPSRTGLCTLDRLENIICSKRVLYSFVCEARGLQRRIIRIR